MLKNKKYLIPLILILLLTFALNGFCTSYTSQYPPAQSDTYVKSTTKTNTSFWAYYATNPAKSLTGDAPANAWLSLVSSVTEQRFHIDLGSAKTVKRIYYENSHSSGMDIDVGIQNFTFWGSNTGVGSFDDLVYGNDEGWTELTVAQNTFDIHSAANEADPKFILVTNSNSYRYYAFKFADNQGDASYIGVRRIELQTQDPLWHTYDQRVKLTIDETKIDTANLTDFPVTAFFTDAQAEEIFAEFDADEDFDRGQFALENDTLLKAEKELFDDSGSLGIYHIKIPTLLYDADTDYYFYYDNDADHNTSYIGIIGSATAAEVWDEYFKLVYHGVDDTTSTVLDSTSDNNDGTKESANNPVSVAAKVGLGQDFSDDYITMDDSNDWYFDGNFTISLLVNFDTATNGIRYQFISQYEDNDKWWSVRREADDKLTITFHDISGYLGLYTTTDVWRPTTGLWYHITFVRSGTTALIYVNGEPLAVTEVTAFGTLINFASTLQVGYWSGATPYYFDGKMDEPRISKGIARTAAWIKATYNSLWDSLLTYGGEEEAPVTVNAIIFGVDF